MNASALLPNITEDYYYYYKNEFYFQPWHDDEYGNRFCDIGINIPVNTYELLVTLRYAIPAFIIVISYSVVFVKLCVRRKSHLVHASTQNSKKQQEATAKLQLMLMVDAFLTLATWLPNTMYYTVVQYQNKPPEFTEEEFVVEVVLAGLTCTNAFSTPLVYLTFNNYFRMDMKLLFNRLPCCKHRPKATSVTAKLAENCNHSASQSSSAKQNSTRKSSQQTASTQATVAIIEEKQSVR
ncbi:neuromedin-B receptor-like isoform X2 [Watersipora subatra]|uniref:neuromedin-B receptor-like isoform X2 n=1 Tax=Watersipora subatra TaxID=2589382 RepID=UPI00355BC081